MTKRQPHEFQRPIGCDTSYANGLLTGMEAAARAGNDDKAARIIACKWLSVFILDGELAYNWQGGYPTNIVSRATALSVLARG
jgi:hypothetical protein